MTLDPSEYGIRQILLVVERSWLFILGVMVLAGAVASYLSYTQAQSNSKVLRVDSVVSMPAVDFSLIDAQSLFAQSLGALAVDNRSDGLGRTMLIVTNLGGVEGGRRVLVRLSVQGPSGETAKAAMASLLGDLERGVRARHPKTEVAGANQDVTARIADTSALLDQLRNQPPQADPAAEAIRKLAVANSLSALALLEQARAQLQLASTTDLQVEVPIGTPFTADDAKPGRWIRLPVLATLGAGFIALLVALVADAWPRLVGRR